MKLNSKYIVWHIAFILKFKFKNGASNFFVGSNIKFLLIVIIIIKKFENLHFLWQVKNLILERKQYLILKIFIYLFIIYKMIQALGFSSLNN